MPPSRIVCLTEEPTETLYALGEQHRIVGISGFTVRPSVARREKPKVSAFTSAKIDAIMALSPDFAIGFSDIQADIAAELVRRGVEVWISNHRSVEGIIDYIRRLGAMVGAAARADAYADGLQRRLDAIADASSRLPHRPRVYFEEWDEPQITGIRWVAELVRIAGGDDIFPSARWSRSLSSASSKTATKSSVARPTSSWDPGAASVSAPNASPRAPVGTRFPRCATASCTK
jgi:iron complex transport system substrate-binding protein